jgi:hypothetical protein
MRLPLLAIALACSALSAQEPPAKAPQLPDGARTNWVVARPEEIVAYLVFDPGTVQHRLPRGLRFLTLEELATGGVPWARDYLVKNPANPRWGISFLEIVRMETFNIDGRAPDWPRDGAVALWFARVASADAATDIGPGRPFLALDFWVPDKKYAAYMRTKGYSASYGDARLRQDSGGNWLGSVKVDGLRVVAECVPTGPVTGGASSAGMQVIFPPAKSPVTDTVRVAFAGHREKSCEDRSSWKLSGTHPLARAVMVGPASFQFGYNLVGGTYAHQ